MKDFAKIKKEANKTIIEKNEVLKKIEEARNVI
jgi:hypothetical protein